MNNRSLRLTVEVNKIVKVLGDWTKDINYEIYPRDPGVKKYDIEGNNSLYCYVWAKDEAAAEELTKAKLAELKASGEWERALEDC